MNDPDADPMTLPKPPRIAAPPVGGAGTVHAAIRAGSHIGAVSADRHILQPVQADQRLYLVQAGGDILQGASAGLGALTVLAGREMHGTVQAEGHVFASAYDQLAARVVSTHGAAVADSWAGISGELEGAAGVHVSAYGSISSPTITSSSGPVALGTYASVSGTVVDAARTSAVGALGRFDGQIVKADTHENLRASLTAGESIRAYVRNEVTGDITSTDGSIYVNAATIRGNRISAPNGFVGLDVFGHLGVSPAPPCPPPPGGAAVQVERGLGITASVLGAIDGSFVSALGGVLLLADGDVSGTVSAGDDRVGIGLVSWGSVSASLTAANGPAIVAFAYGDVSGPIQAGSEVHVNTWSDLTNTVGAGGDAVILARRDVTAAVTTGRDGYVWTFDRYHGNVFAGRDGMIVSLGAVNAGIFAGGSGLIYAVENAIGSVTAGEYAGVITWGTAAGPMTVTGPEGAFGWSYGDFNGFVESSAGSASLTSYGNALGAVRGAQDASLWVLGQWVGDIQAGDDAVAIALGGFHGHATAGASAYLISEADITATLTAGRDLGLWAIGNISGNYQAGRDASAVTYGDFSADVTADRDVTTVWARGDLTGSITASRNVGTATDADPPTESAYPIFSYGQISADITALNPAGVTGGGHIGPIGAWGAIAGRIEAADTIHEIRSGDSVSATLIAPNVPVPSEFDTTIETDHPLPALPESVVDEILAQAAAEYAAVLAEKSQVAAEIADLLADFAAEKAAAATGLADAIAQATANAAAAQVDAVLALGTDLDEATAAMDAAVAAAAAELAALQDAVEDSASSLEADRDQMQQVRSDAYAQANSLASQVAAAMSESDTTINDSRRIVLDASIGLRTSRETNWENIREYLASSTLAGWYHFPPPPDPPAGQTSRFTYSRFALVAVMHDLNLPEYQMAAERTLWGMDAANQGMETLGYLTPPGALLLAGYKLTAGEDLMGRRLTTGQKIFEAFNIGLVLTPVILASLSDLAPRAGFGTGEVAMASPGQVVYGRPWLRWVPWLGKPTYPNPAWWKEATRITYGQELHELRHVVDFRLRLNLTYFANNWYGPGRGVARTVLEHRGYSIQAAVDGQRVLVPLRARKGVRNLLHPHGWRK